MEIEYPPSLYADTRNTALLLFRSLTIEQAEAPVPLNPGWRVTDVASHVCGIVDDVLAGNVDGLGTDDWTQTQVDKRAALTLAEICDEWQGYAEQIDTRTADNAFFGVRLTGDLILHLQDVQHALGLAVETDNVATKLAAHRYVPSLQERAAEQMALGVEVQLSDGARYLAPDGVGETIALRCSSYEFLRSVTGHRSRSQVEALDWQADPTALLDGAWNTYGAMRAEDVSI